MNLNEDRRIRKTKQSLRDALAVLLSKKPLKNITVREISEMADINRGTFYLHYKDVYDMAEQIQNEIFEKFNDILSNFEPDKNAEGLCPFLEELFNLLAENAELAKCLIGKNGDVLFINRLKEILSDKCFSRVMKVWEIKSREEFAYFYHFIETGCIGVFEEWLIGGMKQSPAEMATFTEKLILSCVSIFN